MPPPRACSPDSPLAPRRRFRAGRPSSFEDSAGRVPQRLVTPERDRAGVPAPSFGPAVDRALFFGFT